MGDYGGGYQMRIRFGGPLTPAIKALLIANGAVFFVEIALRIAWPDGLRWFIDWFALTPALAIGRFRVWQFITHAFLHSLDFWHIAVNMFMLWMFGGDVERALGRARFLTLYFAAALAGGVCMIPFYGDISLGASGAVFGTMAIFARLFPHRRVLLFGVFPIKMRTLAIAIVGIEVISQVIGGDGIAHLAHLGGFAVGWFFLSFERSAAGFRRARELKKAAQADREDRDTRAEVDRLLAKVGRDGLGSLTGRERTFLKRASERYRR
jgi:membrane associated rhomboid family serine protease